MFERQLDGEIIPGKSIGAFELGMRLEILQEILKDQPHTLEEDVHTLVLRSGPFEFYVKPTEQIVDQIGVHQGFKGRFKDFIGVGSTLADVETYCEKPIEWVDLHILPNQPGISFDLKLRPGQDKHQAPIQTIYIYPPEYQ